jgi:ABC-type uncharacterized transport system auxiliary subunit
MTMTDHFRALPLILLLMATLPAGCLRLEKPALSQNSYVLSAERTPEVRAPGGDAVLQVLPVHVAAPFAGRRFVYRRDELRFETDFYQEFLAPPGSLVQEEAVRWLDQSGLFATVGTSAGPLPPTHLLQGRLTALYGDIRPGQPAAAVCQIRFMLLRQQTANDSLLFERTYRQAIPLNDKKPRSLMQGWNKALSNILQALEKDIIQALAKVEEETSGEHDSK